MGITFANGTAVALGSFDGLHIGHQTVLRAACEAAERLGAEPVICTFKEHPLKVLTGQAPPAVFTEGVMEDVLANTGMKVFRLDFAEVKDLSPKTFFETILVEQLHAKAICCGFNFTFGAGGKGTPDQMRTFCKEKGIEFYELPDKTLEGVTVSSTEIRAAIQEGNIDWANRMLGRPFRFRGTVVSGDGRGRTWGMPTINVAYPKELAAPRKGVYRTNVLVDGETFLGATNIGTRPTVREGEALSAETFLLDYQGDLYGKTVDIELLEFLRPEEKFPSFDALQAQMKADIKTISKTKGK